MARTRLRLTALLVTGVATALPLATVPAASGAGEGVAAAVAPSPPRTIATGLDNPRHLRFGPGGALYVAEAGAGGTAPCFPGPEGQDVCFGRTGAVTRIEDGRQRRVVTRLPSIGTVTTGASAIGPSDLYTAARGRFVVAVGLAADPRLRATLPAGGRFLATLTRADTRGPGPARLRVLKDIGRFEVRADPHRAAVDSNPTALLRERGRYVVTDAGGNTLLRAGRRVRLLAVFRDRTIGETRFQAVPTSVVKGPGRSYFVSQLTGFPFLRNASVIWRVVPGRRPQVYAAGLTNVTDLAWHAGRLYAVQISDAGLASGGPPIGSLRRIRPGEVRHPAVVRDLPAPYGVAFRGNRAFISVNSTLADAGQVVRVRLS